MKRLFPLLPLVAVFGLIACQGNDGPVAEGAAGPADEAVGDASATGLAAPANAAAAQAVDQAALPSASDGMIWTAEPAGSASFGPPGARPLLTIGCAGQALSVKRQHPATAGTTGTLSFTGGGTASSMPMRAVAKPGGPGESEWRGEVRGDMARAVARAFSGRGPVEVTLGGAPALSVPASPIVEAVLRVCAR